MKSKKKSRRINSYTKPKTIKQQIPFPYKRVRIDWIDIITEGGWGSEKELQLIVLPIYLIRESEWSGLIALATRAGLPTKSLTR